MIEDFIFITPVVMFSVWIAIYDPKEIRYAVWLIQPVSEFEINFEDLRLINSNSIH